MKALKKSASTQYKYDAPTAALLETFPSPFAGDANPCKAQATIKIRVPEFTSLCPITGQPDFAKIMIEYMPEALCVESKSLKLYMGSYRNHGEFHESCVNRMCNDLVCLLQPQWLFVEGRFTPRGGIPFWPTVQYYKPV